MSIPSNHLSFLGVLLLIGVDASYAQQTVSVHQRELEAHRFDATSPDLIGSSDLKPKALRIAQAADDDRPCRTVFGFLPYWESSANIRWDILTHVAAFAVEVNADGTLGDDHGWPWTDLINTAHANGVKVVLVATLFDPDGIETLITTPQYKDAFFKNIKNKMLQGAADGINIDFEGNGDFVNSINAFMAELTEYMHTEAPGSEVTFDGPAVNWSGWDLPGLAASCDGVFIMGYAFAGGWSTQTGANAPLTGGSINITDTLLDEYAPLASTMPEKLILGVPYYGGHWTTASAQPNATVVQWQGSTRFREDAATVNQYGRQWDPVSQTPWYHWMSEGDTHQVWYDDRESLGLKWQLAQDHDLQGVGMWALNYDGTRTELWDELSERFVEGCSVEDVDTTGAPDQPGVCATDGDCDDLDRCTLDECVDGDCQNTLIAACMESGFDEDDDGVPDQADRCPGTSASELPDRDGCSRSQGGAFSDPGVVNGPVGEETSDSDGDSVGDEFDQCPDTPADVEAVDVNGCAIERSSPVDEDNQSGDSGGSSSGVACGATGSVTFLMLASGLLFLRVAGRSRGGLR